MPYDYAKDLLSGSKPKKQENYDYASDLFESKVPVEREYSPDPSGAIDTKSLGGTGKPVVKWTPTGKEQAGFGTLVKSGFVDNPQTKIKIFAKARGISPDRYKIQNGEIIYQDKDGKWYPETSQTIGGKAKRFAGETIPKLIPATMATVGVAGGPIAAFLGGAGGEGIRKSIGALAFSEPQTTSENINAMGMEGAFGASGQIVGKAAVLGKNVRLLKKGKGLKHAIEKEIKHGFITPKDNARAEMIKKLAKKEGITLAPHQLYDKQSLTNWWKYLRQHPQTSDAIKTFDDALAKDVESAMERYIGKVAGKETPHTLGTKLKAASEKAIESAEQRRETLASPIYKKAFKSVDRRTLAKGVGETVKRLDQLIKGLPEKSNQARALNKIKDLLKVTKTVKGKTVRLPDTDLHRLQQARFELNDFIEGTSYDVQKVSTSAKNVLNRNLNMVKESLSNAMYKASPTMKQADKAFERLSKPVERMQKSVIGELAGLKKDTTLSKATQKLLKPAQMTDPKLLDNALKVIAQNDPKLRNKIVGGYIRDTYESLKATETGKIINVAGKMHKHLFGTQKQKELLKTALAPQQYKNLEDLMIVFKQSAIGAGHESMTQSFQAMQQSLGTGLGSKAYMAAQHTKIFAVEKVLGKWNDLVTAKNQGALLDALLTPAAAKKIAAMQRLSPKSEALYKRLAAFLTITAEQGVLREKGR